MRQAEKERKTFQSQISFTLDPGKKIQKKKGKNIQKIKKTTFLCNFQPKRDDISREREKNILVPNSVHTQLGQENFEKNSKKIQKIEKPLSSTIFRKKKKKGMRQVEKEKKKFQSRFPFILYPGKKIPKKIAKKFKKLKNHFPALFIAKTE